MRPIKPIRPTAIQALILIFLSLSAHAQSEHPMPLPDPDPSISSFAAIPANELERLKQAAAAGDSQAALKLSAHFYFYEQNHEAGLYWHIKASRAGPPASPGQPRPHFLRPIPNRPASSHAAQRRKMGADRPPKRRRCRYKRTAAKHPSRQSKIRLPEKEHSEFLRS